MLTDTRAAKSGRRPGLAASRLRASRLRPLNTPRFLEVEAGEDRTPVALFLSGHRCPVETVIEAWRIDDEWWREKPVSRTYWRLFLANGCTIDVYRDDVSGRWYKQAYL